MSKDVTFGQAVHTLTIIGQQDPSPADLVVLHEGYLADLMRAIKLNTVPPREDFQELLGLKPWLKTWKTITLGLHKTYKGYCRALKSTELRVDYHAGRMLEKISPAKVPVEVDLALVRVAELGFDRGATASAIYARAQELGLQRCPAEVGPALRLALTTSRQICIGMDSIITLGMDERDYSTIFFLSGGGGGCVLYAASGNSDHYWVGDTYFVFVRPRK